MAAVVVQRSTAAVLTLDEIKAQCRLESDFADEDALLQTMERAAVRACEGMIGGPLLTAVWREVLARWPAVRQLPLEASGATSVDKIELVRGGEVTVWAEWRGIADHRQLCVSPQGNWPQVDPVPDAITITYRAGFGTEGSTVPEDIRQWLLFRVATLYEYRQQFVVDGSVSELPSNYVDCLLDPYRINRVVI